MTDTVSPTTMVTLDGVAVKSSAACAANALIRTTNDVATRAANFFNIEFFMSNLQTSQIKPRGTPHQRIADEARGTPRR